MKYEILWMQFSGVVVSEINNCTLFFLSKLYFMTAL